MELLYQSATASGLFGGAKMFLARQAGYHHAEIEAAGDLVDGLHDVMRPREAGIPQDAKEAYDEIFPPEQRLSFVKEVIWRAVAVWKLEGLAGAPDPYITVSAYQLFCNMMQTADPSVFRRTYAGTPLGFAHVFQLVIIARRKGIPANELSDWLLHFGGAWMISMKLFIEEELLSRSTLQDMLVNSGSFYGYHPPRLRALLIAWRDSGRRKPLSLFERTYFPLQAFPWLFLR